MEINGDILGRSTAVLGEAAMERLANARVIIFGVGGVGSWCAEALVRSGLGHISLVDPDCVDPSNVNRQLPALTTTVGRPKVEVLRERFLQINPDADIVARQERFTASTASDFDLENCDYVIDAIDSIADKMELILTVLHSPIPTFYSSMGAARRVDPLKVRVTEFWKVDGCPLAATLRKRMRRAQRFPERKFKCVWSAELPISSDKGSIMPVTATFGMALASLVLQDIMKQC